jgi:hypothetical protein
MRPGLSTAGQAQARPGEASAYALRCIELHHAQRAEIRLSDLQAAPLPGPANAARAVDSADSQAAVHRDRAPRPRRRAAGSPTTGTVYVTGQNSGNDTGYEYAAVACQGWP